MSAVETNRIVPTSFVLLCDTVRCTSELDSLEHPVKSFSDCFQTATVLTMTEIAESIEFKASRRASALNVSLLLVSRNLVLQELGTVEIHKVLQTSLGYHIYPRKNGPVQKALLSPLVCQ